MIHILTYLFRVQVEALLLDQPENEEYQDIYDGLLQVTAVLFIISFIVL